MQVAFPSCGVGHHSSKSGPTCRRSVSQVHRLRASARPAKEDGGGKSRKNKAGKAGKAGNAQGRPQAGAATDDPLTQAAQLSAEIIASPLFYLAAGEHEV